MSDRAAQRPETPEHPEQQAPATEVESEQQVETFSELAEKGHAPTELVPHAPPVL